METMQRMKWCISRTYIGYYPCIAYITDKEHHRMGAREPNKATNYTRQQHYNEKFETNLTPACLGSIV